jgi:hypothetical protein
VDVYHRVDTEPDGSAFDDVVRVCNDLALAMCIIFVKARLARPKQLDTMVEPQITQKLKAAPSAKHHKAGMSTSNVLTVCHVNQVLKAPSLPSSIFVAVSSLDCPASVIFKIGPATIGTKARCPKASTAPYAYHLLTAVVSNVACDRSQRLAMIPDAVDVRATPAMRLPAGARNADQNRERARPEIFSEVSASLGFALVLRSWGRKKAKNKGYCSSDMPTVADDVHSGRMRPRWLPRGLRAGIVIGLEVGNVL